MIESLKVDDYIASAVPDALSPLKVVYTSRNLVICATHEGLITSKHIATIKELNDAQYEKIDADHYAFLIEQKEKASVMNTANDSIIDKQPNE